MSSAEMEGLGMQEKETCIDNSNDATTENPTEAAKENAVREPRRLTETRLSGRTLYEGRIVRLEKDKVLLENGEESYREVVRHPGGVSVAALTEKNEVLMVRQFRYPYGKVLLECPAGKLEPGEDPFEAMKREQREETGTAGESYISLGEMYPTPGYCSEVIRMYACRISGWGETDLDADEFLEVEKIPLEEAVSMVMSGRIRDGKTQVMILKLSRLLEEGKF